MRRGEPMICRECETDVVFAVFEEDGEAGDSLCTSCDARRHDFGEVLRAYRSNVSPRLSMRAKRRFIESLARERRILRRPSWAAVLAAVAWFALLWVQGTSSNGAMAASWISGLEVDSRITHLQARVDDLGNEDAEATPSTLDRELAELRLRIGELESEDL